MTKQIDYRDFLKDNGVRETQLPKGIRDKISIFKRLHKLQEKLQEKEAKDVEKVLEYLDIEILLDIKYELQDDLENNEGEPLTPCEKNLLEKREKRNLTDQELLEMMVSSGKTKNIPRSELEKMGIQTPITGNIVIGDYALKKTSWFYHHYDIIPLKNTSK